MGRSSSQRPRADVNGPHARRAREVVVSAVWRDAPPTEVDDATLGAALRLARRNLVEGHLARAYPHRLASEVRRVHEARAAFHRNLEEASGRLAAGGVQPILIKADASEDYLYGNFDLVVGEDAWSSAVQALLDWGERCSAHPAERHKILIHPANGPAAHLHRSVSWFDVPVVPTDRLRARAHRQDGASWWVPAPVDTFRILLAHAAFQNLALDLSELLQLRRLLDSTSVPASRNEAATEGWGVGFDRVLRAAVEGIRRLDAGESLKLPMPLSVVSSLWVGIEHASYLWRSRRKRIAAYEMALRPPLVLAKRGRAILR